jgi:hypothetical protein
MDADSGSRLSFSGHSALLRWPLGADPQTIPPEATGEVARFVIDTMLNEGCRFDLRLFVVKALPAYPARVQRRDPEILRARRKAPERSHKEVRLGPGRLERRNYHRDSDRTR